MAQADTVLWAAAALTQCMYGNTEEHTWVANDFSRPRLQPTPACSDWRRRSLSPCFAQTIDDTTAATEGAAHLAQSWIPWLPAGLRLPLLTTWKCSNWFKQGQAPSLVDATALTCPHIGLLVGPRLAVTKGRSLHGFGAAGLTCPLAMTSTTGRLLQGVALPRHRRLRFHPIGSSDTQACLRCSDVSSRCRLPWTPWLHDDLQLPRTVW